MIIHGDHCRLSSNQQDWCGDCRAQWMIHAYERFFTGLCVILGGGCHHQWLPMEYPDWEKCHCGVTRYTLF